MTAEYRHLVSAQLPGRDYEERVAKLTLNELSCLEPNHTVYRSMGKAYVKSSVPHIQDRLGKVIENASVDRQKLLTRKGQLEESIRAAEDKLERMIESIKSAN